MEKSESQPENKTWQTPRLENLTNLHTGSGNCVRGSGVVGNCNNGENPTGACSTGNID